MDTTFAPSKVAPTNTIEPLVFSSVKESLNSFQYAIEHYLSMILNRVYEQTVYHIVCILIRYINVRNSQDIKCSAGYILSEVTSNGTLTIPSISCVDDIVPYPGCSIVGCKQHSLLFCLLHLSPKVAPYPWWSVICFCFG